MFLGVKLGNRLYNLITLYRSLFIFFKIGLAVYLLKAYSMISVIGFIICLCSYRFELFIH